MTPTKNVDQTLRPPFPHRLKKKNDEGQFKKFLDMLKQLHIYKVYPREGGRHFKERLAQRLDEALWTYRTAFQTPIGMSPYLLVFEKACHLPLELEHKVMWALKKLNLDVDAAGDARKLQLNKLVE